MASLVAPTLGPVARTVAIDSLVSQTPEVLDSGATIARRTIQLADPFEDMGGMLVRHLLLNADSARRLVLALREAVPGVCFGFVRGAGFACETAYRRLARPGDPGAARLATSAMRLLLQTCHARPEVTVSPNCSPLWGSIIWPDARRGGFQPVSNNGLH